MQSPHRIDLRTIRIGRTQLGMCSTSSCTTLMDDVVALDELNSDHVPILLTVKCSMSTRLRPDACHVRWDVFRQHLKLIELPSDSFQSTDALEFGIETFSNTLRSTKIAGQVCKAT